MRISALGAAHSRPAVIKGTPAAMLGVDLLPLAGFTVVLALVATRSFHKRLE